MKFLIRHDITGKTFIVEGRTPDECRRIADTECETRKWNVLEVGSESVDVPAPSRSVERRLKLMRGER